MGRRRDRGYAETSRTRPSRRLQSVVTSVRFGRGSGAERERTCGRCSTLLESSRDEGGGRALLTLEHWSHAYMSICGRTYDRRVITCR
jgi:hypothetical protein